MQENFEDTKVIIRRGKSIDNIAIDNTIAKRN